MTVRVAVIGCGGITAFTHIPQLLNDKRTAEIVLLCDTSRSRMDALRSRYSLIRTGCTTDYREVLSNDAVDAVILAAWPAENARIALDVLTAGKHLLLQKPLMLSPAESERLLHLASTAGTQVLALPFIEALDPFCRLKQVLESEQLGEIRFGRIRTTIPGPADYYVDVRRFFGEPEDVFPFHTSGYAQDRGCLSDMGPYALAAFHFLFGEAKCIASVLSSYRYEETAVLTLVPEAGRTGTAKQPPIATIEAGWSQIEGIELCSVFGSAGSLCIESNGRTVLHTTSRLEEIRSAGTRVMLPMSPFHAQQRWLSAIYDADRPQFQHTVARAVWVAGIIDEVYNKRISVSDTGLPLGS